MPRIGARKLLEHALERLERRGTFVQGRVAVNRSNRWVDTDHPDAVRFCARGHLERSAYELLGAEDHPSAQRALAILMRQGPRVATAPDIRRLVADGYCEKWVDTEVLSDSLPRARALPLVKRAYREAIKRA